MPDEQINERKPSAEELVVIAEGKAQVERAKMAIGQPLPAMHDPLWLLEPDGAAVLQRAVGAGPDGQMRTPHEGTVTVTVPREFVFHATHHHRFRFLPGVHDIPAALMDIPYVVAQGVKVWDRPRPTVETIVGVSGLPERVGSGSWPVGNFVTAAYEASKLSVADWNALANDEKKARVMDEVSRAEAAASATKAKGAKRGK